MCIEYIVLRLPWRTLQNQGENGTARVHEAAPNIITTTPVLIVTIRTPIVAILVFVVETEMTHISC